jgi:uncharacterized protein YkwD
MMAGAATAGGLLGAWLNDAQPADAQSGFMVAREYRVVDQAGVLRGTFGIAPDGSLSFQAADRQGVPRAQFGVGSNGEPFVELTDSQDRTRAVLRVLPDGTPVVALFDAAGRPVFGNQPDTLPPPVTRTMPNPSNTSCDAATRPLDEAEQQLLAVLNSFRQSAGLGPLQVSLTLTRAARWKAAELASHGPSATLVLEHDDSFRTWEQRLLDCGYPMSARFGEVLGSSTGTPAELLQDFLNSQVHREILSDQVWPYIGIARALAGTVDGVPVYRWVVDVGTDPR